MCGVRCAVCGCLGCGVRVRGALCVGVGVGLGVGSCFCLLFFLDFCLLGFFSLKF